MRQWDSIGAEAQVRGWHGASAVERSAKQQQQNVWPRSRFTGSSTSAMGVSYGRLMRSCHCSSVIEAKSHSPSKRMEWRMSARIGSSSKLDIIFRCESTPRSRSTTGERRARADGNLARRPLGLPRRELRQRREAVGGIHEISLGDVAHRCRRCNGSGNAGLQPGCCTEIARAIVGSSNSSCQKDQADVGAHFFQPAAKLTAE